MKSFFLAGLASLGIFAGAAAPALADQWQASRIFDSRVETGTSGAILMHGDNGDLHFIAADTTTISIHARMRTHDAAPLENATIAAQRMGDRFEIDARCPQAHRAFGYTNACAIDATVTYPKGMALDVEWVNGDVHIENAHGDVTAHLTNGDVTVTGATQSVVLSTRHGDAVASLASGWHGKRIALDVSEGDVVVQLPHEFDGYIDASARLGEVTNKTNLQAAPQNASSVAVHAKTLIGDVTVKN